MSETIPALQSTQKGLILPVGQAKNKTLWGCEERVMMADVFMHEGEEIRVIPIDNAVVPGTPHVIRIVDSHIEYPPFEWRPSFSGYAFYALIIMALEENLATLD
jgi:hypothetical protein